jgi:iron(III) transport system substrate-binding protein
MSKGFGTACILGTVFLLVISLGIQSGLAASKQEIVEKAKQEGKLVLYWSFPGDLADRIIGEYNKKYPFIKVTRFQTSSFKMVARYYQEVLARRPTCDMIHITDLLPFLQLLKEGNLLQYDSPEWDHLVDLPKDFVRRGYYAPIRVLPMGVMVNSNLVDPNTIKSYDDCLQEKYKGKIAAGDVEHSDNAYPFYYALRKATNSTHYWKRLGELKTSVFVSSEKASESCVAGEWPVIFDIWLYRSYQYGVKKGAPVKSVVPKEGSAVIPGPSVIMKQASNPNAAKLMQDHLFSREIQTLITEMIGAHVPRKDVAVAKGLPQIRDLKILPLDYEEAAKIRDGWIAEWKKLMNR